MKRARIDLRVAEKDKEIWIREADARGIDLSEAMRRAMPLYFQSTPRKRRRKVAA